MFDLYFATAQVRKYAPVYVQVIASHSSCGRRSVVGFVFNCNGIPYLGARSNEEIDHLSLGQALTAGELQEHWLMVQCIRVAVEW